ncbi:tctex1 domain-containing protein 2-like [Rhopalosiphum maidis]|uniref:tctex1 domain-containing protein 2-like n=1 Tax=Rhopalosiphum maidis TaxID=43146 RepID=UPI000EFDE8BA|nr:tctex1 domain-containing protein 2-like [Rhopalosiphum maidis]
MDTLIKDVYDVLTNKTENELPSQDKLVKYQNTYRLESKNTFNENKALIVIKNETMKHLNNETRYNPDDATRIAANMSLSIRDGIYDLDFERYKIVCIVEIGEKKDQGIMSIARLLRDFNKDKYVYSNFENHHLFATIMVGAFYYE